MIRQVDARAGLALVPIFGLLAGCCLDVNGRDGNTTTATTAGTSMTTGGSSSGSTAGGSSGGECPASQAVNHRPVASTCDGGLFPPDGSDAGHCEQDPDCASNDGGLYVCSCEPRHTDSSVNGCLRVSCQVDSDCPCGDCSPTLDPFCGGFFGIVGYDCHGSADDCINDDECDGGGYCAFQPLVGHWVCGYGQCH